MNTSSQTQNKPIRIRTFVDYWNVQLTMNEKMGSRLGETDHRAKIDWRNLGRILALNAAKEAGVEDSHSFEGAIIYSSFNPKTGKVFKNWITNWLNRQPSVQVECLERQPKAPPKCPSCHKSIEHCPHDECGEKIIGTIEKGVDTLLCTDMIRLAWEEAYDIAVLASSDRDFIPAVNFLNSKGIKVIQAGFPPQGVDLATSCWASFDVFSLKDQILRK